MFHNGLHGLALTHDAAITGGVGHLQGQEGQTAGVVGVLVFTGLAGGNKLAQGVGPGQWHIAREHQHQRVVGQQRQRLLHGVAGAELRFLAHTLNRQGNAGFIRARGHRDQAGLHLVSPVAGDHHHLTRRQLGRRVHHMAQQSTPGQKVQHFGQLALHARALARSHNDHLQGGGSVAI